MSVILRGLLVLAGSLVGPAAFGQVKDVVVGVTPTCPYGLSACWGGAREALLKLDGVAAVEAAPDKYNCTAQVRLKGNALPDVEKWKDQFQAGVGKVYEFRGVEATVEGVVRVEGDTVTIDVPGVPTPIRLAPLKNKLQWNFRKKAARQAEPEEASAFETLSAVVRQREKAATVSLTGALGKDKAGPTLEVREFFAEAATKK